MHKDLEVWKRSITLVTDVYKVTQHYPKDEQFGLVSQIRRASVSIPSNIAEGAARNSSKEFIQFLHIALGSCAEVETQLIISRNLGFMYDETIYQNLQQIKKMIIGLIKKRKHDSQ